MKIKANLASDILAGILEGCADSYISILTKILSTSLERSCFPNHPKLGKVTPVLKEEDELNKGNYHPTSVISHTSKIFVRIVFNQMILFFESKLKPLLTGLLENRSAQNALLNMIENGNTLLIKAKKLIRLNVINDIFYFIQEPYIYDFADDNSLYSIEDNFNEVKNILKKNFKLLQVSFYENHMVLNS